MPLFVKCNVLYRCSCINLMALENVTLSVCRMTSCISRSPISLFMFAHWNSRYRELSPLGQIQNMHSAFSPFLCFTCALHFSPTKSRDWSSVTEAVNSQKTEDICHHSDLLFECHFASTGERIFFKNPLVIAMQFPWQNLPSEKSVVCLLGKELHQLPKEMWVSAFWEMYGLLISTVHFIPEEPCHPK